MTGKKRYTAEEALELLFNPAFFETVMNHGDFEVPNPNDSTQVEDLDYAQSILNLSRIDGESVHETSNERNFLDADVDLHLEVPDPKNSTLMEDLSAQSISNFSRIDEESVHAISTSHEENFSNTDVSLQNFSRTDASLQNLDLPLVDNSVNIDVIAPDNPPVLTNTRKRKCDPEEWCRNKRKKKNQLGESI